jgi:hypothetical protein
MRDIDRVQWSFSDDWLLDVGYVGSLGRKFPRLFSFDQAARLALPFDQIPNWPTVYSEVDDT